ncbi:MAG TPA: ABC transporter ATP-binding protein, partial [Anaerolineales bacterium]|nr:ABC transporter ATP-binding protein [Anaerolineales bacterium]
VNVLQGINIHVNQGELVCMIGPNGAGKSTVLRAISGILKPSKGEILFDDKHIGGLRPDLVLRQGIAHVPQGHSSFPEMTVQENLLMGAYVLNNRAERERRMDKVYAMFPFLKERKNEKAGNFSGGQQKILEVGRALMLEPKMILLDEPSLGLAPITAKQVFDTIKSLKNDMGMTVLMVEQNAKSGLAIADRAYVLELGKERLEGPAKTLLSDPRVAELYLGGTLKS